jgi:hypothetical protein
VTPSSKSSQGGKETRIPLIHKGEKARMNVRNGMGSPTINHRAKKTGQRFETVSKNQENAKEALLKTAPIYRLSQCPELPFF